LPCTTFSYFKNTSANFLLFLQVKTIYNQCVYIQIFFSFFMSLLFHFKKLRLSSHFRIDIVSKRHRL
jgi:hypothetical protein